MLLKDEVELLRRTPLFANVEPTRLKLLCFASERVRFEAGQTVLREGEAGDAAYVLLEGSADVFIDTEGCPIRVATAYADEIIGEIAILCDTPRTGTVVAVTPLDTLRIGKDQFLRLIEEFPEVAIEVMRELAGRVVRLGAELSEVRARLCHGGEPEP